MRVLMLSKALVVGQYQTKAQALALKPGLELTLVVPSQWRDERGILPLERKFTDGYDLIVTPLRLNGNYHLHFYPAIGRIIEGVQPDIIHIDEEPYNLATSHMLWAMRRHAPRARALFFTWQNLRRTYPLPFAQLEQYAYTHSAYALAGNHSAVGVLRAKGFTKRVRVVPQFGVDPVIYTPAPRPSSTRFIIGFAGRLVPEKGATLLLTAAARLQGDWELRLVGSGPERKLLEARARTLGVEGRIKFTTWQPSAQMPAFYRGLDVLVAPSQSRPNWIEQFGRVLIEAMACGVPVIGSTCGEIPNVIGDAGIVLPEGDSAALTAALSQLQNDPSRRAALGKCGRARVLEQFTQQRVVDETYEAYIEMLR